MERHQTAWWSTGRWPGASGLLATGRATRPRALGVSRGRGVLGAWARRLSPPTAKSRLEQAIDLRLALRPALQVSGDLEHILACLREAESLAVTLDDSRRLRQVLRFLSNYFYYRGA